MDLKNLIPWLAALMINSLLLASCRSEPETHQEEAPVRADASTETDAAPEPKEVVYIFDAEGALLPSDEFLVGVRLPRGLELLRRAGGVHIYRTRVPINKVLSYFGPMLITGKVDRQGRGAVYRRASVRGAEVNPTKVDVSITDVGEGYTRVSIKELPPPPEYPPSESEVLERARRDFQRLD